MSPQAAVSALANFGLLAPISAEADLGFWKAPCLGGPFLANVSHDGSVGGGFVVDSACWRRGCGGGGGGFGGGGFHWGCVIF